MASLQYVGNQYLMSVDLAANYVAGSGTMTLSAGEGARLPATGVFWVRQASQLSSSLINILKVTARTGDVLTVVGGQDGTTDQAIAAGTVMCWTLSASALTQLKADISATPIFIPIVPKSVSYPLTAADGIVLTSGNVNITLPDATTIAGREYVVKKVDAPGTITAILTSLAQTIDGSAPPLNLIGQYQSLTLVSDGANWFII